MGEGDGNQIFIRSFFADGNIIYYLSYELECHT